MVSVKENQIHQMHSSRSWDFLGMDYRQPNGLLAKAKYGDGTIIGVIDTGNYLGRQLISSTLFEKAIDNYFLHGYIAVPISLFC